MKGDLGLCSVIAKEIHQRKLLTTLSRHSAGRDQYERLIQRWLFNASIEDDLGYLNNIVRHSAMANRILRDEFQKCGPPKIIPTFENDVLMHEIRMLIQMGPQIRHVTCVEEFHGAPERRVFNSLVMRQIELVRERWSLNMGF